LLTRCGLAGLLAALLALAGPVPGTAPAPLQPVRAATPSTPSTRAPAPVAQLPAHPPAPPLTPAPALAFQSDGPLAAAPVRPASALLSGALTQQVQAALRTAPGLGVHVVDLQSGASVYGYAPDELRVLASNTKLFTTAAALDSFGPGHLFETRFVLRGSVQGGVLQGDLGVVGGGDPNISGRSFDGDSFAVFRQWARALRERGIRRVTGDVYLAHGLFAGPVIHPDWPRDQLSSWYEAPVDALSFNDNCILVRVGPGRLGSLAQVEIVPPVRLLRIDNTSRTVASRKSHRVAVSRDGDLLRVSGAIFSGAGPLEVWVTVPDPARYFGAGLVAALASEGIEVAGRLRPVPQLPGPVWERVSAFRSDLLTALQVTNKRSQNFYAEALFKGLGARRCGVGSWPEGARAVSEFLAGVGIPRGSFQMSDGSGMSRHNRFTPRQVTLLLRHMYFHPAGSEFAKTLPYGGEDNGSWNKRLAAYPYRGNVYAKTGTLVGVSALSGYAKAVSGRTYAFSILGNRTAGAWAAKQAEDRIVMALIDNG
jgi:serine-type D-Ala-D-Ala carboxypeptidase/endopeptidase (penicillin-binding protein 4)